MDTSIELYLNMEIEQLERIAALIGEPARIKILWALMDGTAHTATELSVIAEISPQSASMHLNKLVSADLLKVISQGRHRYYSFAREDVAYTIEAMANLIPPAGIRTVQKISNDPFRYCRSCYDHVAGKAGVAITDRILTLGYLTEIDNTYQVTGEGHVFFNDFGIDTEKLSKNKRIVARPCLDWSERRLHLGGSLGAALLNKMLDEHWVRKVQNSRTLVFTSLGKSILYERLGAEL